MKCIQALLKTFTYRNMGYVHNNLHSASLRAPREDLFSRSLKLNIRAINSCAVIIILSAFLISPTHAQTPTSLAGFTTSPYFDDQVITFKLSEQMTIHIDAAAVDSFRADLPVGLVLYALPNGNTIEHTVGKITQEGDDWHYDIQHIGAQTRFLRQHVPDYNLVTVYLEADMLSWPAWKTQYPDYDDIIRSTVEYLLACFGDHDPFIVLSSHSGGGRFIFSYLDGVTDIPDYIKRICFLDSDYGYEHSYGDQFINWLDGAPDRCLSVLAYNDSVALYEGEPIVSPTGGTWYRSRIMQSYLAEHYTFTTEEDDAFIHHVALDGRIEIILKKNPEQIILHTVQVELNGFIHTLLTGTDQVNDGYTYYGARAYSDLIQSGILSRSSYQIPLRRTDAPTGSQFMQSLIGLSFSNREEAIFQQLITGNIPYFLRELTAGEATCDDAAGNPHLLNYQVMPDYLSIGIDTNYCRVPMGPIIAQRAADFFGMIMPTRKLVDHIYEHADIKVAPVTYPPVGNQNEGVPKFIEHNNAIEAQLVTAGANLGQLIGGTKKDVVLSNLITALDRPDHVTIYGWHRLNGNPIQPLTNIHSNTYVDYSHGIRLLHAQVTIDGETMDAATVLSDQILYTILSDESAPMVQPTYITDSNFPARPASFGAVSESPGGVHVFINADPNILQHRLFTSTDGLNFNDPLLIGSDGITLTDLAPDSILYFKLVAENLIGSSSESEVLAILPTGYSSGKMLVVNGFDRSSTGNTYDFIRQHAEAIHENEVLFESATNDAIIDGSVTLADYLIVDYILGEESTVDETFSTSEQALITSYLQQGGRLFISGAEIAWDLDYRGSTGDRSFIHNYLKAGYSADAPGGVSGTYYSAEGISGSLLSAVSTILFDDGTHGTFNVRYPDALIPNNGSESIVRYLNVSTHDLGGVSFEGLFPGGTQAGKLVFLGFPFETIYPTDSRNAVMESIVQYLLIEPNATPADPDLFPEHFALAQNYPNPFNPETTLRFSVPERADVNLKVYDIRGKVVRSLVSDEMAIGWHVIRWNGLDDRGRKAPAGMYFAKLQGHNFNLTVKMLYLK